MGLERVRRALLAALAGPRRRRVAVLACAFLVAAAVIAGSYLYDEETSSDNAVTIAPFDLKVNGQDALGPVISVPALLPGDAVTTEVAVRLLGAGSGKLSIRFVDVSNEQGEMTDAEQEAEAAAGGPLCNVSDQLYVSVNGGSRSTLKEGLSKTIGAIRAGETTVVALTIEAKSTVGNEYQGDRCRFAIVFSCAQDQP